MRTTSAADAATTHSTAAAPAASSISVTPSPTANAADGAGLSSAPQQPAGSSAAAAHEGAHTNCAASAAGCAELGGGSNSSSGDAAAGLDDGDRGEGSGSKRTPQRQAGSALWQQARCFREMLRKRALTASRDVRGAVFTLLLPVLAVAAVLVRCAWRLPRLSVMAALKLQHGSGWAFSRSPTV